MQAGQYIHDLDENNFQVVLEQSRHVPVIVDFWADWCQPCRQLTPILEKLVNELQGQVILAKVNADEQQVIASQFGVRSLPSLKLVFQGQIVSELSGLQTEAALREWLAPVLGQGASSEEEQDQAFLEQIRMAIGAGHHEQAEQALRQVLAQHPDKHAFRALLVEHLMAGGHLDEAQSVLAEITEDVEALQPFRVRFQLLEEFEPDELQSIDLIAARIRESASPEDLYLYGMQAAAAGHFRESLESLLVLLRDYRSFRNGVAQQALLKVFDCLPKGDPLASEYRRKMFNYLY